MQGFTRLQKLGMCMSRKSTNRKIKEAAQHFQKKVKSWKAVIESAKNTPTLQVPTSTQNQQQVQCLLDFFINNSSLYMNLMGVLLTEFYIFS